MDSIKAGLSNPKEVPDKIEKKVLEEAQAAKEAQEEADHLKYQATTTEDDAEKNDFLAKAQEKEKQARKHSKEARRLASGAWQGTVAGAGMGGGLGGGVGAVVGTLVGTIASIPLAGVGALVGLPVGLIHGPFIGGDKKKKNKETKDGEEGEEEEEEAGPSEEEQHQATIQALDKAQAGEGKSKEGDDKKPKA